MARRYDDRILEVAGRQQGLVTRKQLLGIGMSSPAIVQRLRAGRLTKLHPAIYALRGPPPSIEQRRLAVLLAAGVEAALSHQSAGELWGFEGVAADITHIVVPHGRTVRLVGVSVHRTRTLQRGDVVRRSLYRVTSPLRTIVDLAGVLTADQLEDALDSALRQRLISRQVLAARVEPQDGRGVQGARMLRRAIAARMRGREAGSALESRFRRQLARARVPMPVPQFEIRNDDGQIIGRVDFAYPEVKVAIEVDGYAYHSGRKQWEADLARQNRLIAAGWRVLRFSSRDVDEGSAVRTVKRFLRSGRQDVSFSNVRSPRTPKRR